MRSLLATALCALCVVGALFVVPATIAQAQPLFKTDGVLSVTITGNMRDLLRQRDSTRLEWHGAAFAYSEGDSSVTLPVELRARGHYRRQRTNCEFPPLFVRGEKERISGTELQGNPRLKLVTPCRPGAEEYQQYILLEYGIYRAYEVVSNIRPRTRLATVTYIDSADNTKPLTVPAFFMETDKEVADEEKMMLRDGMTGARFADVHQETLQSLALFEVMVGGNDWSLGAQHNVFLLQDSIGVFYPVAYDWDFAGLINARYAVPSEVLPIKRVTERHYMGPCYTPEQWAPMLDRFRAKRAEIDGVWANIPGLSPKKQEQALKYLDEFWKIIDNPKDFSRMVKSCRKAGN